jgi:hypothetical protein
MEFAAFRVDCLQVSRSEVRQAIFGSHMFGARANIVKAIGFASLRSEALVARACVWWTVSRVTSVLVGRAYTCRPLFRAMVWRCLLK